MTNTLKPVKSETQSQRNRQINPYYRQTTSNSHISLTIIEVWTEKEDRVGIVGASVDEIRNRGFGDPVSPEAKGWTSQASDLPTSDYVKKESPPI